MELVGAPRVVPGGEAIKNDFKIVEGFMRLLLEERLDRHSYVIAIGGGAVLDAVGLAAALVHRGLRLVRVPTTVLGAKRRGRRREERRQFPRRQERDRHLRAALRGAERLRLSHSACRIATG